MVKVELKGVNPVRNRKTGEIYYYAWRGKGAPRLTGKPGSPEFVTSFHEAVASRRAPDGSKMRGLIALYKASPAFTRKADRTRQVWGKWLDCIVERFGDYRVGLFDHPDQIKPILRRWRATYADRPRSADYAIQVLSAVLSYAVYEGRLANNPCKGMGHLYENDRSKIIWTEADLTAFKAVARADVWNGVNLAAHTGLRADDLRSLSWSHVGEDEIVIPTSKSGRRKEARVPLYDELRAVLAEIPKRSTSVLTGAQGSPLKDGPNGSDFRKAFAKAFPDARDLHFHDLRGTMATKLHVAGLNAAEIAGVMGWEEAQVERILRRYVSRSATTAAIIRKLNRTEGRTEIAKRTAK